MFIKLHAVMENYNWWVTEGTVGLEEWRCVSMALGAPSVMISGTIEMPVWCADSWDTHHMVCMSVYSKVHNYLM